MRLQERRIGAVGRRGEGGGEHASERTSGCVSEHAQPTTHASASHGAAPKTNPRPWSGVWIDISRLAPPTFRRIAVVWSLGRLSGRPMRDASAIADLLDSRGVPLGFRTAGV